MWNNNARAALTFSFDDGYKDTYDTTVDLLSQLGLKATYNVPTRYVGNQLEGLSTASWENWRQASRKGMEIASHSVNHRKSQVSVWGNASRFIRSYYHERQKEVYLKNALKSIDLSSKNVEKLSDDDDFIIEAKLSKDKICERISCYEVSSYSYPFGVYNSSYKNVIESVGYSSARSLDRGCNQIGSVDLFALKSMLWNQYMTLEVANQWVDYSIKKGAWLIEVLHLVGNKTSNNHYPDYTFVGDFKKHIEYILSKDIWVDTQKNVTQHILERQGIN